MKATQYWNELTECSPYDYGKSLFRTIGGIGNLTKKKLYPHKRKSISIELEDYMEGPDQYIIFALHQRGRQWRMNIEITEPGNHRRRMFQLTLHDKIEP